MAWRGVARRGEDGWRRKEGEGRGDQPGRRGVSWWRGPGAGGSTNGTGGRGWLWPRNRIACSRLA